LHRSRNDELRYAHTTLNCKYIRTMVYEDDLDFSSEISVDSPWRIKHRDPITGSQAGAGADLTFRPGRERHAKSSRDHGALAWRKCDRGVGRDRRQEVEPGRELALVFWQGQIGCVREPLHLHVDFFHA
jgi:hypothetical protein